MLRFVFLVGLFSATLLAQITLREINSKPSSIAKDFLIWQYLQQKNISKNSAIAAYRQVKRHTKKLQKLYLKKNPNDAKLLYKIKCQKREDLYNIKDKRCLEYAFMSYKTLYMNNTQREKVKKRVKKSWQKRLIAIQSEPYSIEAYKKYDNDTVLRMFINVSQSFRHKHLDLYINKNYINTLAHSIKMAQFIDIVMRDKKLKNLQRSLYNLKPKNLDAKSNFLMALFYIKQDKKRKAIKHLKKAYKKYIKHSDKDKTLFWLYKLTKKKRVLKALLYSKNINIYTLYAREVLKKPPLNFFTYTKTNKQYNYEDIKDPFIWYKISKKLKKTPKEKLFKLYLEYQQKNMVPIQSYILEKAYDYKFHAYVMPYNQYLLDATNDEKALVYAIMRQESRFIPSAISPSYALGLMQLMPFLINEIAQKKHEKVQYKDFFHPKKNIEYARKHIQWLQKKLHHPLLIAYAYNGGIGFLKRHIKSGAFSNKKYEPYLSMELMKNSETREYGKKVLANYIVYKTILQEDVSLINMLKKLKKQENFEYFRN